MTNIIKIHASVEFSAHLKLTEGEIRALDALVGYGDDSFLRVFGEKLGEHYMRDHKGGLKSFFSAVRSQVLPALSDIDDCRKALVEGLQKREARRAANLERIKRPSAAQNEKAQT